VAAAVGNSVWMWDRGLGAQVTKKSETWRGHYPITSFVLEALSKRQSSDGSVDFTHAERVIFVACAFWAASARGSLLDYLGDEAIARLNTAKEAFSAIGAVRVASVLRLRIDDLMQSIAPPRLARIVTKIEDQLAHSEDDVDQLIAAYTANHLSRDILGE